MATILKSYVRGEWRAGAEKQSELVNPSTEEVLAQTTTAGLDLAGAVRFAREKGGRSLRSMTFTQRAELLKKLARAVADAREELIALGMANAGNTRSDAKFDIDGASATLLFYADLGSRLGETRVLADGEGIPLGRSARLYGQHLLVPREGVAVHINAFNFPAWGMAEKLAAALLAGMPVITKPATATAMMAHRVAELWVQSGVLPEGCFTFICGAIGELLTLLGPQDVVAFTGSGQTAAQLRRLENLARHNTHVNVEADSLNSMVLGPDVEPGSETMRLFFSDAVKEITQKAGQKCTAVRRIYVPRRRLDDARTELAQRLSEVRVGNPADERTQMGPLATAEQLRAVREGICELSRSAQVATGGVQPAEAVGNPAGRGFFIAPTLLVQKEPSPGDRVNRLEVFGPVATLMPFGETAPLIDVIVAGGGGLVGSIYSDDRRFIEELVAGMAPHHGRITLTGEKLAGQSVSPGTVLPQLLHGGPGRAGGGEELGGMRGLALYLQRVALQGHRPVIEQLAGVRREGAS